MASINIAGDTSGTLTLSAPLVSGSNTVTLPAATGTISLLQMGTAVASTSGTSVDFTGIPSWAKRITVMISGVSTNGSSAVQLQLGDSGGIENTSYLGTTGSTGGATQFSAGFLFIGSASAASVVFQGALTLTNISGNAWACSGVIGRSDSAQVSSVGGVKELSATLDRVRITTVNGTDTFDAGSINVMWEG
jgi:hypothetical protein